MSIGDFDYDYSMNPFTPEKPAEGDLILKMRPSASGLQMQAMTVGPEGIDEPSQARGEDATAGS